MLFITTRAVVGLTATCGLLLTPFLAASSRTSHADDTPTAEEIQEAAELFSSSCASCHLPPDPEHATDRAWLNQVTDTA
jgi:mono/diheme cytochrome c family protein